MRRYLRTAFYALCIIATTLAAVNLVVKINVAPWLSDIDSVSILKSDMGGKFPIESFVMIEQQVSFYEAACDLTEENCTSSSTLVGITQGSASGSIVGTCGDDCSLVLTAAHVCAIDTAVIPILNPAVDYEITLTTGFGRMSRGIVIATDEQNDLCMIASEEALGPSLHMSDEDVILHQKIYNMASPLGLAVPLAVPVFEGYYSGQVDNLAIFTFPVAPGSSGSPILNEDGEIVSVVSASAIDFDEFAIGCRTEAVRNFLLAVNFQLENIQRP